jgi:hypothetical protein
MSTPDAPSGWEAGLDLLDKEFDADYARRLATLARIHQRYTAQIPGLTDYLYAFARNQLHTQGRYELPVRGPYQALMFQKISLLFKQAVRGPKKLMVDERVVGGGIQFNVRTEDGEPLSVRVPAYRTDTRPYEAISPLDVDQAEEIKLIVDGVANACALRANLGAAPDLTTLIDEPQTNRLVLLAYQPYP